MRRFVSSKIKDENLGIIYTATLIRVRYHIYKYIVQKLNINYILTFKHVYNAYHPLTKDPLRGYIDINRVIKRNSDYRNKFHYKVQRSTSIHQHTPLTAITFCYKHAATEGLINETTCKQRCDRVEILPSRNGTLSYPRIVIKR